VGVEGVSSSNDVLNGGVVGAIVNTLAVASIKFVLELLHLVGFG
jgi:hypothetical protein